MICFGFCFTSHINHNLYLPLYIFEKDFYLFRNEKNLFTSIYDVATVSQNIKRFKIEFLFYVTFSARQKKWERRLAIQKL